MMRKMKDSGVEWIGEIPEDWEITPVKRHFLSVKRVVGSDVDSYERLALTMNGVIKRSKDDSEGLQPKKFEGYQILKQNELVFKLIDLENIKTSRVGLSPYTGLVSPAYIVISNNREDNRYFYYYFMFMYYNEVYNRLGGDGVRSALNAKDVLCLPIMSINDDTMTRIADYLDYKCDKIDAIIAKEQAVIEKLKAYKLSLITETVTKGLNPDVPMKDSGIDFIGMIPEHWVVEKIKYVSTLNPSNQNKFSANDEVGYVPMECVKNGYMIPKSIEYEKLSTGLTYFEDGDIVLAKVTPCFENGNISIAKNLKNNVAFGSSELFVFRCHNMDTDFLFYALQNSTFTSLCISTMTGTGGLKRVSSNFVRNYKFALPSEAEQQAIADYLNRKCTEIDKATDKKQAVIDKLTEYKKSLIYEVVTGKKEV